MSKLKLVGFLFIVIALLISIIASVKFSGISLHQVLVSTEKRLNIELPRLKRTAESNTKYKDHVFDGTVKSSYPRIVLPELTLWDGSGVPDLIQKRLSAYEAQKNQYQSPCDDDDKLLPLVVCNLISENILISDHLDTKLNDFELVSPKASSDFSNGWELALAYDLSQWVLIAQDKVAIEAKLARALNDTLVILDDNSASLWHTRATHAAVAWVLAIVLPNDYEGVEILRRRAQGHFLSAIDALSYTEVWPEGYNYWIQNRAFLLALAASAYINGLEESRHGPEIKELMRKIGYWHIYATRPDNKIEGYGDEGSRVDLKDETRRVIDLIAQVTEDSVLFGYSRYLAKLQGAASYYRGYRWGFLLFHDPFVSAAGNGTLASLEPYLAKGVLLGENTTNYAYLRSGWKPNDTFLTFKAGHSFTHHGHYDAGHFTLFKGAPLAINSSSYGDYFSDNRLNYSIRTVAKNSLLILKPEEKVRPNKFFDLNVADGGQRVVLPTGSAITSVGNWLENYQRGLHLEGAELLAHKIKQGQYYYFSADLTPAYNNSFYDENGEGGKVRKVLRDFLYLPDEDQLVIYDRVNSTDPSYIKKWLLHTVKRPQVPDETVLKGTSGNGISESRSSVVNIQNKNGRLTVTKILPKDSVFRIVGGPDFQYYVETDGDETELDGKNYHQGSADKPWFDIGMWRLELQPVQPAERDKFLVVLSPSIDSPRKDVVKEAKVTSGNAVGVITSESVILFANGSDRRRDIDFELPDSKRRLILIGLSASGIIKIEQNEKLLKTAVLEKTVTSIDIDVIEGGPVNLSW